MNWDDYVNSLEKISLEDIKNIIRKNIEENLDGKEEFTAYGFRKQRNIVFFGKFYNGTIPNPNLFTFENEENLCEELYNILQKEFPNVFNFNFEHSFSGEYDYYGYANDDKLEIQFPNFCQAHQEWIFNQVKLDRENNGKSR